MANARFYKADGAEDGTRELPEALFDGVVHEDVLHQVVRAHLLNRRQGTGSAKNRSEVRGGSRKPWRQKGTGRARQGSIRSVQWVGGGRAFPPQPHSWRTRVPRKVRALARRSALNARAADERILMSEAFDWDKPRTRRLREFLESVEAEGRVLILTTEARSNLVLSARNMPGVEVRVFGTESTYDVLLARTIIVEDGAFDSLSAAGGDVSDA
ncbi:MAG: 50S ribosomal protein L4 [Gemmatimonadales bacterium]|nr:MAG: 50S ribosomal protein L4 [Gemmatimonadales bacterium]